MEFGVKIVGVNMEFDLGKGEIEKGKEEEEEEVEGLEGIGRLEACVMEEGKFEKSGDMDLFF